MRLIELSTEGEPRILAAGLTRSETITPGFPTSSGSLSELADGSDAVLVFDGPVAEHIADSLVALWREIPERADTFIALVPRRPVPRVDPAYGEPISSFICSADVLRRLMALGIDCWARTLCFAALRAIADGAIEADRLLVREVPCHPPAAVRHVPHVALLLPHRGPDRYLRAALRYLERCEGRPARVHVGLDVDDVSAYAGLLTGFPEVEFYSFDPAPVGPYVIRQELAERSNESFVALQDSDDISCYDRFSVLSGALATSDAGIVGSHELCIDDIRGLVQPVRFPLDCTGALRISPNHALLHATLMTRRDTFFAIGGLSTDRIIANDTQFLLRAYFLTTIRNVDRFLYVRRRHAASLTNAPETIYDNPLRRRLNSEWTGDFNAIKRGEKTLEDSSLRAIRRTDPWRAERLTLERRGVTA